MENSLLCGDILKQVLLASNDIFLISSFYETCKFFNSLLNNGQFLKILRDCMSNSNLIEYNGCHSTKWIDPSKIDSYSKFIQWYISRHYVKGTLDNTFLLNNILTDLIHRFKQWKKCILDSGDISITAYKQCESMTIELLNNFVDVNTFEDFGCWINRNFNDDLKQLTYSSLQFLYSDSLRTGYPEDSNRILNFLLSNGKTIDIRHTLPLDHINVLLDHDIFTAEDYKNNDDIIIGDFLSSIIDNYKYYHIELNSNQMRGLIKFMRKCDITFYDRILNMCLEYPDVYKAMYNHCISIGYDHYTIMNYLEDFNININLNTYINSLKYTLMVEKYDEFKIINMIKNRLDEFIMFDIRNSNYDECDIYNFYNKKDIYDNTDKIKTTIKLCEFMRIDRDVIYSKIKDVLKQIEDYRKYDICIKMINTLKNVKSTILNSESNEIDVSEIKRMIWNSIPKEKKLLLTSIQSAIAITYHQVFDKAYKTNVIDRDELLKFIDSMLMFVETYHDMPKIKEYLRSYVE